ncbi:hypothetical protein BG015_004734 [Linnemannia schmuckeri]|uniref:F-box domain-containing protein n=1 Tax=Linnemannia schmuckeri TaxID=64567 RepID=A0A9P5VCE1_9FUNG|nr:hypothetical protein BG015_004734 [Linnemannia schmuckeri]
MDTTSFDNLLPEMASMTGQCLNLRQLKACVHVCRAWKTPFQPFLWRHVRIDQTRCNRPNEFITGLRTVNHLIQSVRLEGRDFADVAQQNLLSVREVLNHTGTLVVLRVEDALDLSNVAIGQLLCGLPNLKEFYMLCAVRLDSSMRWEEQCFESADLVLSEWTCTNLEVFDCTIRGIPRRDTGRLRGSRSTPSQVRTVAAQESISLQRRVCSQLGRLTKLKELTLKALRPVYQDEGTLRSRRPVSNRRDWRPYLDYHIHDCLAMSLGSGLDLLVNLGELRRVDLEDMDAEIANPAELAWVAENWPLAAVTGYPEAALVNNDDIDYDELDDNVESDDDSVRTYRGSIYISDDELDDTVVDFGMY